jgi:hypothetical protein
VCGHRLEGAPIATGGQSRNATVSSEPSTMPPLSPVVATPPISRALS